MLVEPLLHYAQKSPNDVFIHDDRGDHTFAQIAGAASALSMLISFKTQRPNVGLLLPSSAAFVASFYGTLLAGKTVVPINFLLGPAEVAHVLKDSGVDLVISIGPLASRLPKDELQVIDLLQLPQSKDLSVPTEIPAAAASKKPDDIAVLMYTSGTSGLPKGVCLSFDNLQSDVDASIKHARLERKHRFLGVLPLFHAFGMTAMMLAPIQLGATVIFMARFNPVATINAIRDKQVSLVFAVPSMFAAIANVKAATADDFKSIYAMMCGGEPTPSNLIAAYKSRFNVNLYEGYGLTETSPVAALNVPNEYRTGSVGKPVPGLSVRIVDDAGIDCMVGDSGEVWLKGPMVMRGYYNLPRETAAVLTSDGFFKTGDLGKLDADGFLHITGRKKDLIIVAGEKAVPREIEEILMKHPTVAEAAVVGKKDASRGEVVVAFVLPREKQEIKPEDLRDFCRKEGLMQWKIPREIFVEKDLPRSPTGKILKRELIARLAQPVA